MKTPHLMATLATLALLALFLVAGENYAGWMENRYIHAVSSYSFPQKRLGSALQREAFRQPDLLPLYGSSEVDRPDPFHANQVFLLYPTGFTTFPVGGNGSEPLIILQKLAAIGPELEGKKVAISLSPVFFLEKMTPPAAYAGNFSLLHAYDFAFSTELSWELKEAVARRMLDYPDTLGQDRLLNFAIHRLSDGSPVSRALYYAVLPLGEIKCWALSAEDHWQTLTFIWDQANLDPAAAKRPGALDWATLLLHAEASYMQRANNNPFGFQNTQWERLASHWLEPKGTMDDGRYLRSLHLSQAWSDLDLLLREMKELGAKPMLMSIPFPGRYYDFIGVSRAARQEYYDRLQGLAKAYGVDEVDFQGHDEDMYFFLNPASHLSSVGWVYYAEALDAFYHGKLASPAHSGGDAAP